MGFFNRERGPKNLKQRAEAYLDSNWSRPLVYKEDSGKIKKNEPFGRGIVVDYFHENASTGEKKTASYVALWRENRRGKIYFGTLPADVKKAVDDGTFMPEEGYINNAVYETGRWTNIFRRRQRQQVLDILGEIRDIYLKED